MNSKMKVLYRSRENKILAGVLAGLAEYFNQDPLIWRLGFVILLILTGLMPGVLIYIIAWLMIPEEPLIRPVDSADYTVS